MRRVKNQRLGAKRAFEEFIDESHSIASRNFIKVHSTTGCYGHCFSVRRVI